MISSGGSFCHPNCIFGHLKHNGTIWCFVFVIITHLPYLTLLALMLCKSKLKTFAVALWGELNHVLLRLTMTAVVCMSRGTNETLAMFTGWADLSHAFKFLIIVHGSLLGCICCSNLLVITFVCLGCWDSIFTSQVQIYCRSENWSGNFCFLSLQTEAKTSPVTWFWCKHLLQDSKRQSTWLASYIGVETPPGYETFLGVLQLYVNCMLSMESICCQFFF